MTHSFEAFWSWLQLHPNCLLQVATPEAVLYDDDAFHWYVGTDQANRVVQQILGKRLASEILIDGERVAYVQEMGESRQGEHVFEAVAETPAARLAVYTFVVSHGFDGEGDGDGELKPHGIGGSVH